MAFMRVTYMSRPTPAFLKPDFRQACMNLSFQSAQDNKRNGLTGALIVDPNWFVQTIEGEKTRIMPLFQRILKDRRHSEVRIFELVTVQSRIFPGWAMHVGEMAKIEPALVWECVEGYRRYSPTHARTLMSALHSSMSHPVH